MTKSAKPNHSAQIDDFDKKILALWQHNTRLTSQSIGEEVGLSAASVQRRLNKLRSLGVIQAEVAKLDAGVLGLPVTLIVGVDIEREHPQYVDAFKASLNDCPEVQQCYFVTGEYDFILVVVTESLAKFEAFARTVLLANENVVRYTTFAALDVIKNDMAIALP